MKDRVFAIVKQIPSGKVMSYGQVALFAGHPKASRVIGGILMNNITEKLPWWRVVNNKGALSIKGNMLCSKELQKSLLTKEGVEISDAFMFDIEKYRFIPANYETLIDKTLSDHNILTKSINS